MTIDIQRSAPPEPEQREGQADALVERGEPADRPELQLGFARRDAS